MSNCCTCTYQISGCYNVCADILLELEGIENGTYTVNAGYYSFSAIATDGVLTIPAGTLNENDCQELQIEGYSLTVDGKTYDCFKLKTKYELVAADFNGGGGSSEVVDSSFCQRVQLCMAGITVANFANTDLTFTDNRQHDLNGFSAIIREPGIHSFQLGTDAPAGMIPIPGLKFSGFTGSNATDSIMTLNGNIKGIPGHVDVYVPSRTVIQGDPFNTGGKYLSDVMSIQPDGVGGYNIFLLVSYLNTIDNINVFKKFIEGDYYLIDANDNDAVKWQLGKDGSISHDGAYANKPTRYTAGGNVTIPDNVSVFIYDPASIQAGATITLPANPLDGQDLYIIGGGTITSGNVITGFTLDGNGRTVIGDGAANLRVGKAYELHYCGENNIWYAISF